MKKKLFLIALPALMVLSGCSKAPIKPVEKETLSNTVMFEDTVAHDDLFGDVNLNIKKLGAPEGDPVGDDPSWTKMPKIGVQFSGSYKGYERDGEGKPTETLVDYYAVRFVAAIAGLESGAVTAEWTRGVSEKDGNEIKALSGGKISTVEYATLNNNSVPTNASSEGTGYNKYIVYTLYDIPASQVDSYVVAYLTLSKAGQVDVASKAVAARIGGENAFSFDSAMTAHFLQGKINNVPNSLVKATEEPGGNNYAAYYGIQLLTSDSFGSFYYSPTHFCYFGYEEYFTEESQYNESVLLGGYVSPKASGTYNLYLSNDSGHENDVYTAEGHIWTVGFGGDPIRLDACEVGGQTKYYIENISVTQGQTLSIFKDGVEDSTVYSVKENVSQNNIYTDKKIKNSGTSSIYLNTDGGIWVNVPSSAYVTINIDIGTWLPEKAASHVHAWAWKDGSDGGSWYTAELGEGSAATVLVPNHCTMIKLTRNGSSTPDWGWNTTCNVTIESGKTLTVTGWDNSAEFK